MRPFYATLGNRDVSRSVTSKRHRALSPGVPVSLLQILGSSSPSPAHGQSISPECVNVLPQPRPESSAIDWLTRCGGP